MTANGKTIWLLLLGCIAIAFLVFPFRMTTIGSRGIQTLTIKARALLVERYEAPALSLRARTDSLRRAIVARFGGTTPTQDSLLKELEKHSMQLTETVRHLRNPEQATLEEQRMDVGSWLEHNFGESRAITKQLVEDYLK